MTDAEWAKAVRESLAAPDEPAAPAPTMIRQPRSETQSDEELGIESSPIPTDTKGRPLPTRSPGEERMYADERRRMTPEQLREEKLRREAGPLAEDPIAQGIVAGIPAAGVGALVAPLAGPVIAGAGSGATAAKLTGGDPWLGAAFGGAAGMLPAPVRPSSVKQAAQGVEERFAASEAQAPYRAYGQAGTKVQRGLLKKVGADDMREVLDKYSLPAKPGVGGSGAAFDAAQKEAGIVMGANNTTMARDFGGMPLDGVIRALDKLQARYGQTTTGEKMAEAIASKRTQLLKKYGDKGTIDPGNLQREITALEKNAYHSPGRSPGATTQMQRDTARAFDDELQAYYDRVAQMPGGAARVEGVRTANRDYRVLARLGPIAKNAELDAEFAPTFGEKLKTSPVEAAKEAGAKLVTAPIKGVAAIGRGIGKAKAKAAGIVREGAEYAEAVGAPARAEGAAAGEASPGRPAPARATGFSPEAQAQLKAIITQDLFGAGP